MADERQRRHLGDRRRRMVGVGDLNADSRADILWRCNDGAGTVWQMDARALLSFDGRSR